MAPGPSDPPVTHCCSLTDETAGQSCGFDYPNKTHPGLCSGCAVLARLSGVTYQIKSKYPRCVDCGSIYQGMNFERDGQPLCGTCSALSSTSTLTAVARQQQAERTARMLSISGNRPNESTLARIRDRASGASGVSSSSSSNTQPLTPRAVTIAVEAYYEGTSGKPKVLPIGWMMEGFTLDDLMEDVVLQHFLRKIGISWDDRHENSLELSDVTLRFMGGGQLNVDLTGRTVHDLVQAHRNAAAAAAVPSGVLTQTAKKLGTWPAFQYFQLHIQADLFYNRTGETVKFGVSVKRQREETGSRLTSKKLKTAAQFEPVVSRFVPRQSPSTVLAPICRTLVELQYSCMKIDDATGSAKIDPIKHRSGEFPSYLHDVAFARGTMKTVYKLDTPQGAYVAKRFHQASADEQQVTIDQNDTLIRQEVELLALIEEALGAFKKRAKEPTTACDIDDGLAVTLAYAAYEFVPEGGKPSTASNLPVNTDPEDYEGGLTWLVEPFRHGRATKFVGTLNHQIGIRTGKLGATVHAFIHFFYQYTKETLVLVDVQTMKSVMNGTTQEVIFDPMVHSTDGQNGPGDHGQDGIDDFLQTHICNTKCQKLKLKNLLPSPSEDSEEDD
ncbi:kinase-like domain-containing protein [Mycena amicta]|nr:kinase-like domain-containing protein [Mycena amicta]